MRPSTLLRGSALDLSIDRACAEKSQGHYDAQREDAQAPTSKGEKVKALQAELEQHPEMREILAGR